MTCPGRLALCGVPCGCEGRNPSHYPTRALRVRVVRRERELEFVETPEELAAMIAANAVD